MPIYLYREIFPDGSEGDCFEVIQGMSDPFLKKHPKTGNPVRKVFAAPNLPNKYTEGATKAKLTDENVEKHGFTRYEKDRVTGDYFKTAGKDERAPDTVKAGKMRELRQKSAPVSYTHLTLPTKA